ncbi:MAG: hypothetical protein DRI44_00340 [Chlamydiae bacterium]|nr:MAG: hypothetical protein DRI44_00340 [Chlamydiota bacterium]
MNVTNADKNFYKNFIKDFLPKKIIDIHTHIWRKTDHSKNFQNDRSVSWPMLVADENPIEQLLETYKILLPETEVTPLVFGYVPCDFDELERFNNYVSKVSSETNIPGLIFSHPEWSAETLEQKIISWKFIGVKSYLSLSKPEISVADITIFDFFPKHHLEVLDKLGMIMMLHIPRNLRLKDPVNLKQLIEIENNYPNIKLIVAHVGRAYCEEDVGNAFEVLSGTKNLMFDFSANCNSVVFEKLIQAVGPKRILFGTDLPILKMRTHRICENGKYINLVPKGLYGDVSNDPNMREVSDAEAEKITFFLYEELAAFFKAAKECNLTKNDLEDIFYNNAIKIINDATVNLRKIK